MLPMCRQVHSIFHPLPRYSKPLVSLYPSHRQPHRSFVNMSQAPSAACRYLLSPFDVLESMLTVLQAATLPPSWAPTTYVCPCSHISAPQPLTRHDSLPRDSTPPLKASRPMLPAPTAPATAFSSSTTSLHTSHRPSKVPTSWLPPTRSSHTRSSCPTGLRATPLISLGYVHTLCISTFFHDQTLTIQ